MKEMRTLNGYEIVDSKARNITENSVTPQMFGANGDGVTDDTNAIQQAFNSSCGTIMFPDGEYLISNTITDEIGHNVMMGNSVIKLAENFVSKEDYAININIPRTFNYHKQFCYKFNINCEYRGNGVVFNSTRGNKFDLVIKGVSTIGVCIPENCTSYENIFNIQVENNVMGEIGVNNLRSDNIFESIIAVNFKTAVVNKGFSYYKYIHPWLYGENGKNAWGESVCYKELSNSHGGTIDYLYIDTVRHGIVVADYGRVYVGKIDLNCGTTMFGEELIQSENVYVVTCTNGNGHVHISNLSSYFNYEYFKIFGENTDGRFVTIDKHMVDNWLLGANFSDVAFSFKCNSTHANIFSSLPQEMQDAFSNSTIAIERNSNGVGFKAIYWGCDGMFVCTTSSPNINSWKKLKYYVES